MRTLCGMFMALLTLLWGGGAAALEIVAISPSTVTAGARVGISGGPFEPSVQVWVGEQSVVVEAVSERQLTFVAPALPAGDYRLTLQNRELAVAGPFLLRLVEPAPTINAIHPFRVDLCSPGAARTLSVEGQAFAVGARLLLGGAQVPAERLSAERVSFALPELPPGMHQVEIVNPDGSRSLPFAVVIDGTPEILAVTPGEDRVIAYDLVIHGRNFSAAADLVVDGVPVNAALAIGGKQGGGRETVKFVDCETLIYTRYPVNREPRQLSLAVVAPGAEGSAPFHITAP